MLTGKYRGGTPSDSRGGSEHLAPFVAPYLDDTASGIVDAVATAADGLAVTPLQVALAWVRARGPRLCFLRGLGLRAHSVLQS